jgi:hypothetical protein
MPVAFAINRWLPWAAAWLLVLALALALPLARPAWARTPGLSGLRLADGRVSMDLKDAPAGSLLEELGKKAGFAVKLEGEVDKIRLNESLKDLPLEVALRRLLLGQNYLLTRDEDGQVASLLLIAPGENDNSGRQARKPRRAPSRPPASARGRVTHVGGATTAGKPDEPDARPKKPLVDTRDGAGAPIDDSLPTRRRRP